MSVYEVPLKCPSSTRLSDSLVLWSSIYQPEGARTGILDVREWPPTLSFHEPAEYTLSAGVSSKGELLSFCSPDRDPPRDWLLRTYANATDPNPSREEEAPFALPDLSQMLASLNDTDRYIESGQDYPVDALCFVGERALLVPRHVGIASFHPWIQTRGGWTELTELPRFVKPVDDSRGRPGAFGVTLGDGADVLVWNRHAFEWDGRSFVRSFEHEVPLDWTDDSPLVPSGSSGFFCVSGGALLEVTRGNAPPRRHLDGMYVSSMCRGPDGKLFLDVTEGWALYDPAAKTLADLSTVTKGSRGLYWSSGGFLIVARGTFGTQLSRVSRSELDSVAKRDVEKVLEAEQQARLRTEEDALDADRSRSRPRVGAMGKKLFTACNTTLQEHDFDEPVSRTELGAETIALAVSPKRAACLDASGAVRFVELASSKVSRGESVVGRPRSLVGSGSTLFAVLGADWTTLVGDLVYSEESRTPHLERRSVPFEGGIAGCFTPDGSTLILTGERRSAALVDAATGAVEPLPQPDETIHALANAGAERCIGFGLTGLHALDLRQKRWTRLEGKATFTTPGDHLAVSPNGKLVAVESTDRQVEVLRVEDLESLISVGYPDSFQSGGTLEIVGLAFMDDRHLVIGLSGGNANIVDVDAKNARRIDAPKGEQNARWVFILDGSILIAE